MASEYTPNRRYPLYTDNDKPNLRDQYNGAIREIDTDMAQALSDSSSVSAALGAGFDAQHTVRMAIDASATSAALDAEVSARESADSNLSGRITSEASARESADDALSSRITSEVSAREGADSALGSRITSEVSARESADAELANMLNNLSVGLSQRNFILLGDSFGSGIYPVTGGHENSPYGWLNRAKLELEAHGCTVYTNSDAIVAGNSGFTSSATFLQRLTILKNNISDRTKITDIVVLAGTNDSGSSYSDIAAAVSEFCTSAKSWFPNAFIKIGCLGTGSNSLNTVARGYRYGTMSGHGYYIDSTKNLLVLPEYISSDGTHLTADGYAYFERYIVPAVIYGKTSYSFQKEQIPTVESGYTIETNCRLRTNVNEHGTYISMAGELGIQRGLGVKPNTPFATGSRNYIHMALSADTPKLPEYNFNIGVCSVKYNKELSTPNGTFYGEHYLNPYGAVYFTSNTEFVICTRSMFAGLDDQQLVIVPNMQFFIPALGI